MSWPSITLKAVDPEHGSAAAPRSWPTRENSSIVLDRLRTYVSTQAANPLAYARQEAIIGLLGWVPSLPGIALRGVGYRAILEAQGTPAIEQSVRIRFAGNVRLGRNVFIDHGVYLHACPPGIDIGDDSYLMHDSILHVFNFRDLPHAGIRLGKRCFVGERTIIRGQGGVMIGDDVLIAPAVQVLAINHVSATTRVPIMDQGIDARGIEIADGSWLGAGSIITDGVRIGRNAVVGAGAVVTRDVPDGAIVAGVPARVVREIPDIAPPVDASPASAGMASSFAQGSSRPTDPALIRSIQ
jgi:acetyltransferase-like isoleucine patch superfamily enzyme